MSEILTCDQAQVCLERARYGALGGAESTALEQHLAGCAVCRAWRASVGQAEQALEARAAQALETVSWPRLERVLRSRQRRTLAAFGFAGGVLVLMNLSLVGLVGGQTLEVGDVLRGLVPELAIVLGVLGVWQLLERRRRSAQGTGETLEALRRELTRDLRSTRLARWLLLGCAAFLAAVACWPPLTARAHLVLGGFVPIPLAGFALLQWSVLPRMRRERADLRAQDA